MKMKTICSKHAEVETCPGCRAERERDEWKENCAHFQTSCVSLMMERDEWREKAEALAAYTGIIAGNAKAVAFAETVLADRIKRERAEAWDEGFDEAATDHGFPSGTKDNRNPYRD